VALVLGDEVARSGAIDAVVELAERVGAPVFGSPLYGSYIFPPTHPLWRGLTGHMFGPDSARAVAGVDAVLVVGTYLFPEVFPLTGSSHTLGCGKGGNGERQS